MTELEQKVYNVLNTAYGQRMRMIASLAHTSIMDTIHTLHILEEKGIIARKDINDFANMEYYTLWLRKS